MIPVSPTFRPLSPVEGGRLLALCGPLAAQFPAEGAFEAWEAGLVNALAHRAITAWVVGETTITGALLWQGQEGLITLLAGLGELPTPVLSAMFDALQQDAQALIWDEAAGPDWPARLADRGVKPYVLESFVQDLAAVEFRPTPEDDVVIRPWRETDAAPVVPLLAAANAGTLAGLFLTMPSPPTEASYARFLDQLLAGASGRFLPEHSYVAEVESTLLGAVLSVLDDSARPFLLELAVTPAARGRQISRRLVATLQRSLLAVGHPEMVFLTTGENTPVHRLFRPEEITHRSESRGGYWLKASASAGLTPRPPA